MTAGDVLRLNEERALSNRGGAGGFVPPVNGNKKKSGIVGKLSATGFLAILAIIVVVFFLTGSAAPSLISDRLEEETDTQYAYGVESKAIVIGQALSTGDLAKNTVERLKQNGATVGRMQNGEFIEGEVSGESAVLLFNDRIITADEFYEQVNSDARLYDAVTSATYDRAGYYYDEAANAVFRKIGTNRNNFTADADFDETMSKMLGEGSDLDVNNVVLVQKVNENGESYYEYETIGGTASSEAEGFVESVRAKNTAATRTEATLNAADALNTADTISKEQRSSLLYLAFMENISKMKAGYGNQAKVNEMMNYLYTVRENEVVDVNTGKIITVTGSMIESPSLYAVLSGEGLRTDEVTNYTNDRVLKTVENQIGVAGAGEGTLFGTVTSTGEKVRGSIGRFVYAGGTEAGNEVAVAAPIIQSSLITNQFETIGGITGGEMLVEGAVNVGKELAKASGASAGDAAAAKSYARLTSHVLALDAEVDRNHRSPFDITSRNTFLGKIFYDFAVAMSPKGGILTSQLASFSTLTKNAVLGLIPSSYADDESERYLANFGDCEKIGAIGAVGSANCSMIATFDTSTLNDPFNNPEFMRFVNENTILENGVRKIKENSKLADYIKYNNERITPIGTTDGGILSAITNGSKKIPVLSDIVSMIKTFLGASESEKRIATGAAFVNSAANGDWDTYKWAQIYTSLARATDALRQYDGDETAYSSLKFFEGTENPVIAFINEYVANK